MTSNSSGAVIDTVKYFPFGGTRSSTAPLDTDKLFTGQRLDQTGLYFYNARYYDATIGRFISPDTVVPDWADPQSLNRYAYVTNNPLKYIDPLGLDKVIVGGSGSTLNEMKEWEQTLIEENIITKDEAVILLPDLEAELNAGMRYDDLVFFMQQLEGLTNITLIGFSEGGAAVALFLNELSRGNTMGVPDSVIGEIKAAIMLEMPSGKFQSDFVGGYDSRDLGNLPERLAGKGYNIALANIYNTASVVHTPIKGWEAINYPYHYRSGWATACHWGTKLAPFGKEADYVARASIFRSSLHTHVKKSGYAMQVMYNTIPKNSEP